MTRGDFLARDFTPMATHTQGDNTAKALYIHNNTRLGCIIHEYMKEIDRELGENTVNLNPPLLYTNNLWDYHFLSLSGRADRICSLSKGGNLSIAEAAKIHRYI